MNDVRRESPKVHLPAPYGTMRMSKLLAAEGCTLSPDNKQFAFEAYGNGSSKIWVANIDGTASHVITTAKDANGGSPAWSPDGTRIAYDSSVEGRDHIYVAAADGSHPRRLKEGRGDYLIPTWSRDGKWIYLATNASGAFEVARMPAGGGEVTEITHGGGTSSQESVEESMSTTTTGPPTPGAFADAIAMVATTARWFGAS